MSWWRTVVRNELKQWIRETGRQEATLRELQDQMDSRLAEEFPENDNIDAGLRRTLQELRDEGDIEFLGDGEYRLTLQTGPDLAGLFEDALRGYPEAREIGDFQHDAAKLIKDRIPEALREALSFDHITIRGSVGYGGLANIPWIGIFDERVTSDPKDGLYIVYLFDTGSNSVFLTLNQGMTDLQEEYGRSTARDILSTRASLLRSVVDVESFEEGDLPLTSDLLTAKNNLYGTSSICHREYALDDLPGSATWISDVSRLVEEYQRLIDEGVYDELLAAFDESTGEQEDPFDNVTPGPQPERIEVPDGLDHPLSSYLEDKTGDIAVYMFTAPPDYWLTSIRYRAISFEEQHRDRWEQVSEGDLALIHSRAEPGNPALEAQPSGFIGAGIIGRQAEKDEDWWWDEFNEGQSFPYVLSFERLFTTGDIGAIDQSVTIDEQSTEDIQAEIKALTSELLGFSEANERCQEATGRALGAQGSFSTFHSQDGQLEYERPRTILTGVSPLLTEISPVNIHFDVYPDFSPDVLDGLYFPGGQGEEILDEIEAAIRSGKHVVLTGPPGTGKTEIAERVAVELVNSHPHLYSGSQVTTATADWSTFDTVGGYMPSETSGTDSGESLSFTPGMILNRLRDTSYDVPVNEPIVVDELNRADIDKAFGQLFTVLSGQSVTLPYTRGGEEIEIRPVSDGEGEPQGHEYVIPNSWRILATMNTYDKTSLYEMSYAFMRRFAFVRVGAPDLGGSLPDLMDGFTSAWEAGRLNIGLTRNELQAVGQLWRRTNSTVDERAIGPAIVRDIVLFLDNHDEEDLRSKMTKAVVAYIFPQLEGVPKRREIVDNIANLDTIIQGDELRDVGKEMLQITFEEE